MNRPTRLAAVIAVAAVLALGATALSGPAALPAHAGGGGTTNYVWMPCDPGSTTGALTSFGTFEYRGFDQVWRGYVTGHIFPCQQPAENEVFAVAGYDSNGVALGWAKRYPTSSTFTAYVEARLLKTVAVCLLNNSKDRLDCVAIEWVPQESGPARPVAGAHIPVNSPAVAFDAVVDMGALGPHPGCPGCVEG
jgi:hypothetical protein